jgi:hypothetical protein
MRPELRPPPDVNPADARALGGGSLVPLDLTADLVGIEPGQIREWVRAGLLRAQTIKKLTYVTVEGVEALAAKGART